MSSETSSFSAIRLRGLEDYLLAHGWLKQDGNSRYEIFQHPEVRDGDKFSLRLPRSTDEDERKTSVRIAVSALSKIEDVSIDEMARRIRSVLRETMIEKLRDVDEEETVPFDEASDAIWAFRKVIELSADAERMPEPHLVDKQTAGKEFIRRCRFAHTFRGSFGMTVEVPLPSPPAAAYDEKRIAEVPFARRAVTRFATGIKLIQAAVHGENPERLVANFATGFNANVLDAFIEFKNLFKEEQPEISVRWATSWPVPEKVRHAIPLKLEPYSFDILKAASKELKAKTQYYPIEASGYVELMKRKINAHDYLAYSDGKDSGAQKEIGLASRDEHGEIVRLHMRLSDKDYSVAITAHTEKFQIIIAGKTKDKSKRPIEVVDAL